MRKNKLFAFPAFVALVIGMLFSVKLPKGIYIGDIAMEVFGWRFSRIICVIVVLLALYISQKYSKESLPKFNFIMRVTFTILVAISLLTNSIFK